MGEFEAKIRLEAYADLITPRLFRGEKTMWIYGENDRLIDATVEVAWTLPALFPVALFPVALSPVAQCGCPGLAAVAR